ATSPVACAPTSRDEAAAIARSWWDDVWNGGESGAASGLYTDHVVHHWGIGPDTTGRAAMAARLAGLRDAFPDLTVTHGPLVQDGDYVAATWVIHATQQGEHPSGIAPTGKPVTLEGIDLIRIECGRIAEIWTEMDAIGMLRQLSVMPATPEAN
ncbi:MAG TPA: ester cyclase, partial [Thermomicrobiales bacterium]|nr:ester cyclase [Thermomicrobiales bacterium]